MRLSAILCIGKGKFVKGIPGCIWIGKHRFVPPVTRKDRMDMWKRLMYEEEVMMYLKNPYLTEEEENKYFEKYPDKVPETRTGRLEMVYPPPKDPFEPLEERTMAFHLDRLNLNRGWEK